MRIQYPSLQYCSSLIVFILSKNQLSLCLFALNIRVFGALLKNEFSSSSSILCRFSLEHNTIIVTLIGHYFAILFDLFKMFPTLCHLRRLSSHLFLLALTFCCSFICLCILFNLTRVIRWVLTWNIGIHVNRFFHCQTTFLFVFGARHLTLTND